MEKIRIITDTGADFPKPYPANLTVMSLSIRFGDEEYRDAETIDHATFYRKLAESGHMPKTSLVPPTEFEAVFRKAGEAGETVIAILLSSTLSGTYQSAVLAAQDMPHVYVVDSLTATLAEYLLVRLALQLADRGCSAAEIVAELETRKAQVRVMGVADTLEYLQKGGRISKTTAFVGGALNIKPALELVCGNVGLVGKVRGPKNADAFMIHYTQKLGGIDFSLPFTTGYTGSDTALHRFIRAAEALWVGGPKELPITSVGATIGTYLGPNGVVLAFFVKESV